MLYHLFLVCLLAPIALIDADASVRSSTELVPHFSKWTPDRTASKAGISAKNLLRTNQVVVHGHDEERGGLSIPIVEKLKTGLTTSKISPDKLSKWLANEKPTDIVFARMGLDQRGKSLFSSSNYKNLAQWLQYADDLNAKNPTKGMSAILTLAAHYDDTVLYDMVRTAKAGLMYPKGQGIATKLQEDLIKHWLATSQKPDDVFQFMKIQQSGYSFRSDSDFVVWIKYVDDFNARHPKDQVTMASTLTKDYTGGRIFKDAEKAKNMPETDKSIAIKLQDDVERFWLNGRIKPDDALDEIGLGKTASITYLMGSKYATVLEKPLFKSWARYLNAYNLKYPEDKMNMIEVLTRTFGDARVAKMLELAKMRDSTRSLASNLKLAQLGMWANSGKSVDDVYKLLNFEREDLIGDFADKPFRMWVSYMNTFLKKNPDEVASLLSSLQTRFRERPLNQLLLEAKKFPSMKKFVVAMQMEKLQGYLANNESPKTIFKLLALDNVGDTILADSLFPKWMKYIDDFTIKNPQYKESWFETLKLNYQWFEIERIIGTGMKNPATRKITEKVEAQWIKYELDEKSLPKDMFLSLNLKHAKENPLLSPMFESWVKYLKQFNERYPKDKTTVFSVLDSIYVDEKLLKAFNAAKKNQKSTKELKALVADLQTALISKWTSAKEKPADLRKRFHDVPSTNDMIERYAQKIYALSGNTS